MGRTRFSGPVYGAKTLLWNWHKDNLPVFASSQATVASIVIPAGQDWFITEVHAGRGSTASTGFTMVLLDDSTNIASARVPSSVADSYGSTVLAPDGGEYEGKQVAAGSTLQLMAVVGSSTVASTDCSAWVYGYIRFVDSSRAAF